jgi:hypothetical protein
LEIDNAESASDNSTASTADDEQSTGELTGENRNAEVRNGDTEGRCSSSDLQLC